jgi:hypothetical protein
LVSVVVVHVHSLLFLRFLPLLAVVLASVGGQVVCQMCLYISVSLYALLQWFVSSPSVRHQLLFVFYLPLVRGVH